MRSMHLECVFNRVSGCAGRVRVLANTQSKLLPLEGQSAFTHYIPSQVAARGHVTKCSTYLVVFPWGFVANLRDRTCDMFIVGYEP